MEKPFGTETTVVWKVEHYNDPKTTTQGYEGWRSSNSDCFPHDASTLYQQGRGFATLEDALRGIQILRTQQVKHLIGAYKWEPALAFRDCPLRLVKVTTVTVRERVSEEEL